MKIFISWSEERSEALAKALREWLPLVLYYVQPWLSKSDIDAGERWSIEIAKELESCNFGVICITRQNLNSPWILFESGALAKSMQDGRLIPLLLDLDFKEISGPLAQFQAKKVDINGIRELVASLNKAAPSPVPDAQLEKLFIALWSDLEKQIISIPKAGTATKINRPTGEILEELVSSVRNVEMRVRDVIDDEPGYRKRKRLRFHPAMLHDMPHLLGDGPDDPILILIVASLLRDDAPWIYEIGLEAYRSARAGDPERKYLDLKRFMKAIELIGKGPFLDLFSGERLDINRSWMLEALQSVAFNFEQIEKSRRRVRKPFPPDLKE